MTSGEWRLAAIAARFLEWDEREAVLGDLTEAGENWWDGLLGVLGLLVRRQLALWQSWRPWLAGFGVALLCSWTLMGVSVSICWSFQHYIGARLLAGAAPAVPDRPIALLCQVFLLLACSWTGGYVIGSVSRRTLWVSAVLCFSPCLFCLSRFRIESLSRLCLLLFLLPAIHGVRQGLLLLRIRQHTAIALAGAVTLAMVLLWTLIPLWILTCTVIWPVWYLAAVALRPMPQNPLHSGQEIDIS